ncbi:hypothetical protein MP228_004571 [Amoeboaphelidium protococcarum]|nr:hypothetical protein MP228_004571 [Amoeboaphelidium protococcarum]
MPKGDPGGPKAIAKQLKAKGLQKLKFYCQMCEKQCRDDNGFKSHCQTEGHQRQLLLFANNPNKHIRDFSAEFLNGFVSLLSRRYGTTRVWANKVYQEYISDRNHLHMNATCWSTLSGFVQHLGKKGICKVEDDGRGGWYITWIDNSPRAMMQTLNAQRMQRLQKDQDDLDRRVIDQQVARGQEILQLQQSQQQQEDLDPSAATSGDKTVLMNSQSSQKLDHVQDFNLDDDKKISFSLSSRQSRKRKIIHDDIE